MTVFEKIRSMDIDEFAEFLDDNWTHDNDPTIEWWNQKYCNNCDPIRDWAECFKTEVDFAWCELNGKCKYFPDLDEVPDSKQMIKMWLESEEF